MKEYTINEREKALHKILNDTSVNTTYLDIQDIVRELSKINNALAQMDAFHIDDFESALRTYKQDILSHLEDI